MLAVIGWVFVIIIVVAVLAGVGFVSLFRQNR